MCVAEFRTNREAKARELVQEILDDLNNRGFCINDELASVELMKMFDDHLKIVLDKFSKI